MCRFLGWEEWGFRFFAYICGKTRRMEYKVLNFSITPRSEEAGDVLSAMLAEVGFDSFETTAEGLRAYVPAALFHEEDVRAAIEDFFIPGLTIIYNVESIESRDWNEEWEQHGFDPVLERTFGIRLNPQGAFGSGSHETTYQLVECLCGMDFKGQQVLDMGCGTGVLGIAMAKRGAAHVVAIDIDDLSVANTRENFGLNQCGNFTAIQGDASAIQGVFDTIVANIHKNIILHDLSTYVAHLRRGGMLITSGFFTSDVPEVVEKAEALGLQPERQLSKNDWAVILFRLP